MVRELRYEFSIVEGNYTEHIGKLLEALGKAKMLEYREFDLERLAESRDLLPMAIFIVGNYYSLCHTVQQQGGSKSPTIKLLYLQPQRSSMEY